MPTFSIVTAVRNGLDDLRTTIASLESQSSQDFELIVIDGASTDGTADWLSAYQSLGERFRWISESDNGISDAWNKGINLSRGQQVLILNAGDTYDSDLIEEFGNEVDVNHITCCHARLLNTQGEFCGEFKARPSLLWRGMHIPHNWASVPKKMYLERGLYKLISHAMDFEWFHAYYKDHGADGFKVVDKTLGSYGLGGHSDINYKDSFAGNERILVLNGMPRPIAALLRMIYTFKHQINHRRNT